MTEQPPSWSMPGSAPGDSSAPPPAAPQAGAMTPPGALPQPTAYPYPGTGQPSYGPPVPQSYAEYRPGIVPIRPLAINDIFNGTVSAIRGNPAATMGLGLVTTLAFVAPATLLASLLARSLTPMITDAMGAGDVPELGSLVGTLAGLLPTYAGSFAVLIMTAFTAYVIGQGVIGHKVSLGQTWAGTKGRLWRVIGAAILVFLMTMAVALVAVGIPVVVILLTLTADQSPSGGAIALAVGFIFLGVLAMVAAALFFSTRWAFVPSVITLEDAGVGTALRRSWRLTSGRPFWRILGIRLLILLIAGIGGSILGLPITQGGQFLVGFLGLSTDTTILALVVISALAAVLTGTLTTPFTAGGDTLLYIDQRIRREGLDVALIRSTGGGDG